MIRLSDSEWERIQHHFPEENISEGRPGRKPVPTRKILEAALWILNTGAQWHMLPQCYPNYKTAHRRFQAWCHSEVLRRVLTDIANELRTRGVLDEEESFIDATFAMAKGGDNRSGAAGSRIHAAQRTLHCDKPPATQRERAGHGRANSPFRADHVGSLLYLGTDRLLRI
jgi:transposase